MARFPEFTGQPFEIFMSLGKAGGALMADVEALGRLGGELSDKKAMLGYSPRFVDRLLADLRRR